MRQWLAKNKDRVNARRRATRTLDTLKRERAWRANNRNKVLEYKKRDREKHPEQYKRWKQEWEARQDPTKRRRNAREEYKRNNGRERDRRKYYNSLARYRKIAVKNSQARRARLANVPQEPIDRDKIFARDEGKCGICGRRVSRKSFSLDHIVPLVAGGPHVASNLQLAHINCNKRRGHRGPAQLRLY